MTTQYYPIIGLEIHTELNTTRKMFCACLNNPDETEVNKNICPVCVAHPGTLPVPNKQALEKIIRVGLAVKGIIANFTEFDRKNYFYPDIPKGYQLSQHLYPIVTGGKLAQYDITRIHLEEDTGTNQHTKEGSLVDFNRAGVPLMELVTEPMAFSSVQEAIQTVVHFAKEYQLLLSYIGVAEANMEKGEFRVEANISLLQTDKAIEEIHALYTADRNAYYECLSTKTEVKNLNSFKSVEKAIDFELKRMQYLYENNKTNELVQETRGWDDMKQVTVSQRIKENAADYKYFPDPDIPKFKLKELFGEDFEYVEKIPELPSEKRIRYTEKYGIKSEDIEIFLHNTTLCDWFEKMANTILGSVPVEEAETYIQSATNFTTSDLLGIMENENYGHMPDADAFAKLIVLYKQQKISSRVVKDMITRLTKENFDPEMVVEKEGLIQKNDSETLKKIAQKIIEENPTIVKDFTGGKDTALMGLVGRVMKETKGSANPELAQTILRELLQ